MFGSPEYLTPYIYISDEGSNRYRQHTKLLIFRFVYIELTDFNQHSKYINTKYLTYITTVHTLPFLSVFYTSQYQLHSQTRSYHHYKWHKLAFLMRKDCLKYYKSLKEHVQELCSLIQVDTMDLTENPILDTQISATCKRNKEYGLIIIK